MLIVLENNLLLDVGTWYVLAILSLGAGCFSWWQSSNIHPKDPRKNKKKKIFRIISFVCISIGMYIFYTTGCEISTQQAALTADNSYIIKELNNIKNNSSLLDNESVIKDTMKTYSNRTAAQIVKLTNEVELQSFLQRKIFVYNKALGELNISYRDYGVDSKEYIKAAEKVTNAFKDLINSEIKE